MARKTFAKKKNGNVPLGPKNGKEFLDKLGDYPLFKRTLLDEIL
jgi:hypothetical protein